MSIDSCLQGMTALDPLDADAAEAALHTCTEALLDPTLWWWALGLTVACALVGAGLGALRGRWLAGLLWSLALGPIGWLVVLLMRGRGVECPDCARDNPVGAKRCRQCGVDLEAAAKRSPRSALKRAKDTRGW